eukprot:gene5634-5595_t
MPIAMHSTFQRANTLSTVTVSTLSFMTSFLALSTIYFHWYGLVKPDVT